MMEPDAAPVSVVADSGLTTITFHDPDTGNALNPTTISALNDAFVAANADDDCRVIRLQSGHETDFCRGMDLTFVASVDRDHVPTSFIAEYQRLLDGIHAGPKPVIACVTGSVRAGGVGIVAACDIVLATSTARFALTEAVFGLVPFNVLPWLMRRVSFAKARWMIITAAELDGPAAVAAGLIDELVPDDAALAKALRRLMKQLLRMSPAALASTKQFTDRIANLTFDDACLAADGALTDWFTDPANLQVLRDFRDGDTPPWFARYKPATS